jgi:hypothetical protein
MEVEDGRGDTLLAPSNLLSTLLFFMLLGRYVHDEKYSWSRNLVTEKNCFKEINLKLANVIYAANLTSLFVAYHRTNLLILRATIIFANTITQSRTGVRTIRIAYNFYLI